jgi:hypothetical protein
MLRRDPVKFIIAFNASDISLLQGMVVIYWTALMILPTTLVESGHLNPSAAGQLRWSVRSGDDWLLVR